jgi:hypothetical protein
MKRSVTQSEAYTEAEAEACLSTYNPLSVSSTYKGRDGEEKAKVRSLADRTKPELSAFALSAVSAKNGTSS